MKNKYIGILLIGIAMLLNACSSDDSGAPQTVTTGNEPVGKVVQLVSYASSFTEKELSHRAPAGFTAYTPDKTTSMGIYMLLSENPATDWASQRIRQQTGLLQKRKKSYIPTSGMRTLMYNRRKRIPSMAICPK